MIGSHEYPARGMCGIAGTVGTTPDRALLERMAQTMVNRGPDGQGVWADDVAGLACRRLMVIDLHERSNQPLHLEPLHLVFNGEIYNYKELRDSCAGWGTSSSQTETARCSSTPGTNGVKGHSSG